MPEMVRVDEIGAANGAAALDGGGKVPIGQLPTGAGATEVALGNHTHPGQTPPLTGRVLSDQSTTSTTLVAIPGLDAFTLAASKVYRFRAVVFITTNASTVGIQFGVGFTGTVTGLNAGHFIPVAAPAAAGNLLSQGDATAVDTKINATNAGPGATRTTGTIEGLVEVGASGGTFSFKFASETGAAVSVHRGSYAVIEEIA